MTDKQPEAERITPQLLAAYMRAWDSAWTYYGCIKGKCRSRDRTKHCPECLSHLRALDELRELTAVNFWSPTGLADSPDPPASSLLNASACAAWRRSWQLHCALKAAAAAERRRRRRRAAS